MFEDTEDKGRVVSVVTTDVYEICVGYSSKLLVTGTTG